MITRVLDTSVAVAWYLPESFAAEARHWRQLLLDGRARLLVPSLHFWEMANVLRTYVRRGELSGDMAKEIFAVHLDAGLTRSDPMDRDVLDVALDFGATAYDAVYIALALQRKVPLLTAERTTTPWLTRLGPLANSIHG